MTSGIHHVTLITRKVQANVDFYAGFLGLRLVKQTGGYEDAEQLHLFYGDAEASPGSLITFLVWEDGAPGRVGHGQVSEVALAISPTSIGFWLERALRYNFPAEGPSQEFGEPVLRLRDPDGVIVKLVGADIAGRPWPAAGIPEEHAVRKLRGATILSETPEETSAFVQRYSGFSVQGTEGTITRLVSDAQDVADIRDASGFWPGIPGTGTADHIAFRVTDVDGVAQLEQDLSRLNSSITNVHDRKYFTSLYVREPAGTLLEFATDGPGFAIDEPVEHLGERLFVPPSAAEKRSDLELMLPQFSMPGEERVIYRELPFVHRFHIPADGDGKTLVLLHGTGGNEADLMPLGGRIVPRSTLLGVRGRSTEEGVARWFRRYSATSFDQKDIRFEADAFAAFIEGAHSAYGLTPENTVFLGYSNGANLLGAMLLLHPSLIRKAVLLRASSVLDELPPADLTGLDVLMISGAEDPYAALASPLEAGLRENGAEVNARTIDAGHALSGEDATLVREWLERP